MDIEEICDRLKIVGYDTSTPGDTIAAAVAELPEVVLNWVLDHVWFFWPDDINGAAMNVYVPSALAASDGPAAGLIRLRIAYIAAHVDRKSEAEQKRIICREIAHHWLRHDVAVDERDYQQRERQVEALLREWRID